MTAAAVDVGWADRAEPVTALRPGDRYRRWPSDPAAVAVSVDGRTLFYAASALVVRDTPTEQGTEPS